MRIYRALIGAAIVGVRLMAQHDKPTEPQVVMQKNSPSGGVNNFVQVAAGGTYNEYTLEQIAQAVVEYNAAQKDGFAKEFLLGYTLLTFFGEKKHVIPFRDSSGNLMVVDWSKADYEKKDGRITITLPDLLVGSVAFCGTRVELQNKIGESDSFIFETGEKRRVTLRNVRVMGSAGLAMNEVVREGSFENIAIFDEGGNKKDSDTKAVLTARLVKSFEHGEIILLGLKAAKPGTEAKLQLVDREYAAPKALADGRTRIGPFITGEPTVLVSLERKLADRHKAADLEGEFKIGTELMPAIMTALADDVGAANGWLSFSYVDYLIRIAISSAMRAGKAEVAIQYARQVSQAYRSPAASARVAAVYRLLGRESDVEAVIRELPDQPVSFRKNFDEAFEWYMNAATKN